MDIMSLGPGIRFHPTDVELVKFYLKRKVLGKPLPRNVIAEVDVYKNEPWDLPDKSYMLRDMKWYFFCPLVKSYTSGDRVKRRTDRGYWKTTGRDRPVLHKAETVGMIKTLVYHQGKAPRGDRTNWVMREYRLEEKGLADRGIVQDSFVLCTIFLKEGRGPRNGAQYGAPFKEDDWSDDDKDTGVGNVLSEAQLPPVLLLPSQSYSVVTNVPVSESMCPASTSGCKHSEILLSASAEKLPTVYEIDGFPTLDLSQIQEDGDYLSMLDLDPEDHGPDSAKNTENELLDDPNQAAGHANRNDFFENLGDLRSWFGGLSENGARFAGDTNTVADYDMDQIWAEVNAGGQGGGYIQLADLDTPLNGPSR